MWAIGRKQYILEEGGRVACHLIVFLFVAPRIVSTLRLKFISGVMHWRQVVSASMDQRLFWKPVQKQWPSGMDETCSVCNQAGNC